MDTFQPSRQRFVLDTHDWDGPEMPEILPDPPRFYHQVLGGILWGLKAVAWLWVIVWWCLTLAMWAIGCDYTALAQTALMGAYGLVPVFLAARFLNRIP